MSTAFQEQADGRTTEQADEARRRTASILDRARSASIATAEGRPARANPWLKELTHVVRRVHLYAGLFLLPWVFLYGVTGLLFNHPTWFTDQTTLWFGRAETAGTALEKVPTAAEIAGQVVVAINARGEGGYRLINPQDARYERGGLGANVVGGNGKSYSVTVSTDGDGGTVREGLAGGRGGMQGLPAATKGGRRDEQGPGEPRAEGKTEGRGGRGGEGRGGRGGEGRGGRGGEGAGTPANGSDAPFEVRGGLTLKRSPLTPLEQGLPAVLAKIGLAGASVSEVRAAPLSFLMEGGGKRWFVNYTIATGAVTGRAADEATVANLSTRRFLTSLHTTHGYPATFNARWTWAVIVDIMSLTMVFWGISGIVMWWQIKRTRRIGAVLLILSIAAAAYVGMGMHEAMAIPGGGR